MPEETAPKIGYRKYRCILHNSLQKDPFMYDIGAPNAVSAILSVAHVAHLLYPQVTTYEVYDLAEGALVAKVELALAISATVKKIAEWLGIPMPLNAARIVRPKGDSDFDLASYFQNLRNQKPPTP